MKQRVISAIIALAIVIPLIILGNAYFTFGVSVIGLIGYYEIIKCKKDYIIPKVLKVLGGLFLVVLILSGHRWTVPVIDRTSVIVAMFIALLLPVIVYDNEKYNFNKALYLIASILFLGIAFALLIIIRDLNIKYLIMLILITTMTDMFAFFFGKLIGKNKLCPNISPKKTWEGTIMGSIIGTFIASMYYITFINSNTSLLVVIGCVLLLSLVGQLGDLLFSAIKRTNNIKDFSNIMPGHGGILDRLDSLIMVILTFSLLMGYL